MSVSPIPPGDADWNVWVALTRHVDAALRAAEVRPLFSQRTAIARHLWDVGHRPTDEQVAQVVEDDRRRQEDLREADLHFAQMLREVFAPDQRPTTHRPEESPDE